jgi:multidrug efflux pump subunit AcrB
MEAAPELRGVHLEWGERALVERLEFDQARLRLIGLTPQDAANQLQALLSGVTSPRCARTCAPSTWSPAPSTASGPRSRASAT